jgi:hypothetical protein
VWQERDGRDGLSFDVGSPADPPAAPSLCANIVRFIGDAVVVFLDAARVIYMGCGENVKAML